MSELMNPHSRIFSIEQAEILIPKMISISEEFDNDMISGFELYIKFIKSYSSSIKKIASDFAGNRSIGLISPRLLRNPLMVVD